MSDHFAAIKLALEELQRFAATEILDNEDAEYGVRACCRELSFRPHAEDCNTKKAIDALSSSLAIKEKDKKVLQPVTSHRTDTNSVAVAKEFAKQGYCFAVVTENDCDYTRVTALAKSAEVLAAWIKNVSEDKNFPLGTYASHEICKYDEAEEEFLDITGFVQDQNFWETEIQILDCQGAVQEIVVINRR
jgi:hypothetical protein